MSVYLSIRSSLGNVVRRALFRLRGCGLGALLAAGLKARCPGFWGWLCSRLIASPVTEPPPVASEPPVVVPWEREAEALARRIVSAGRKPRG